MAKWSGRGIPPTRRKLHRVRAQILKERQNGAKVARAEAARWEFLWNKTTRRAITNPERFEELWCR